MSATCNVMELSKLYQGWHWRLIPAATAHWGPRPANLLQVSLHLSADRDERSSSQFRDDVWRRVLQPLLTYHYTSVVIQTHQDTGLASISHICQKYLSTGDWNSPVSRNTSSKQRTLNRRHFLYCLASWGQTGSYSLTYSMAYGTRRFNAASTRALQ